MRESAHIEQIIQEEVARQPYPLLFVTISGAHLYGFPSPDSDYDLRGVHILPARELLGILPLRETIEASYEREVEFDVVTHDAGKFFTLLLKRNGYVLEQLYSPFVIRTTPEHEELKEIARTCITRHHLHHYRGFAHTQWALFTKEDTPRVKPLLYVYRVLLTGIHLMRTGSIEANLAKLNEEMKLPYIDDLIAQKREGPERGKLTGVGVEFHRSEFERLLGVLEEAGAQTDLPESPAGREALNDLLVRVRIGTI